MTYSALILLIGVPVALGAAIGLVGRRPASHWLASPLTALAMVSVAAGAILTTPGTPLVLAGTPLSLSRIGRLELIFLAGLVGLLVLYLAVRAQRFALLPLLPPLVAAVAAGRAFDAQLLVAAAFVQLAALLASVVMIGERLEWQASVAGAAYLVLSALGGMALLFGLVLADLQRISPGGLVTIPFVVAVLTIGFALLWGAAPLHFWVPNTAEHAGHVGVIVAVGVVGPATLGLLLQALAAMPQLVSGEREQVLFLNAAVAMAWFGALAALAPGPLRRVLGYALVSDIAFVIAGTATLTRIGVVGAVAHVAHRSLVTLVLFGAAAELEQNDREARLLPAVPAAASAGGTGSADGAGDARSGAGPCAAPYMWLTLLLGTLTLLGVPPLGGFAADWAVYQAVALQDWRLSIGLAGAALVCLCALLAALGRARQEYPRPWRRPRPAEWLLMGLACVAALWGLAPGPLLGAIHGAVSQLAFLKPF